MFRIGIAIDDWKQPTFERILTENGYTFETKAGVTSDTRMIYVETEDVEALYKVVQKCQLKAAELKG